MGKIMSQLQTRIVASGRRLARYLAMVFTTTVLFSSMRRHLFSLVETLGTMRDNMTLLMCTNTTSRQEIGPKERISPYLDRAMAVSRLLSTEKRGYPFLW